MHIKLINLLLLVILMFTIY